MKTALYRHFAIDGGLLYVGISDEVLRRNATHFDKANWFSDVAYTTIEWFEARDQAMQAETRAIILEMPAKNFMQAVPEAPKALECDLLKEVEVFCGVAGMPVTTFGKLALGDPGFVGGLRNGRSSTGRTIRKVKAFIKEHSQ